MIINCARSPFELAPVRSFLEQSGHRCELYPEKLALALLSPLDDDVVGVRQSSHLTDSATRQTQLRFYSDRMVHQHLRTLAYASSKTCSGLERIRINHCEYLGAGAALFFRILARHMPHCEIELRFGGSTEGRRHHGLTAAEHNVRNLYLRPGPLDDGAFETLFDAAHRCSYVGNYWSAERILTKLELEREHREVNVLLGIAASATARPFRAEYYYLKNYRGDDMMERVRACYSLSMLCIRHHAPSFRNIDQGERYLQEAYAILCEVDPRDEDEELSFRKVFNRNGHALVLFKRGQVREALAQLDRGIARLSEIGGEPVGLHRSVLTYNKMLCHRALGDAPSERACFHELMELDPRYPYYRLDYANSLLAQGCLEEAIAAAERARDIDPFLAESHAIMGKCYRALHRPQDAAQSFERAHELDPLDPYYLCHLGSVWNELDAHQRTYDALRREDVESWDDTSYESGVSLLAESSVMVHHTTGEAVAALERGLERLGASSSLEHNLELMLSVQRGVA